MEKDQNDLVKMQKDTQKNKERLIAKNYYFFYVPKVDISAFNYIEDKASLYYENFQNYYDFELLNIPLDYDII